MTEELFLVVWSNQGSSAWALSLRNHLYSRTQVIFMKRHFDGLLKTLLKCPKTNSSGLWLQGPCHLSGASLTLSLQQFLPLQESLTLFSFLLTPSPLPENSYSAFKASEKLSPVVTVPTFGASAVPLRMAGTPQVPLPCPLHCCCQSALSPPTLWSIFRAGTRDTEQGLAPWAWV